MGYEVETNVYNMRFWRWGFKHENVRFIPKPNHRDIRTQARKDKKHAVTGKAVISVPKEIENPDKAIDYTEDLLKDYELLLIFIHCHDVFFNYYTCYEKKIESREKKKEKMNTIITRKPPIISPIIYDFGIGDFIQKNIPLIQDDEFVNKTGIKWSLLWMNEALNLYRVPIEIKFATFFVSLEILANTYARENEKEHLLTSDEYDLIEEDIEALKDKLKELLDNKKIDPSKRDHVFSNVGSINRKPIREKISELLNHYNIVGYEGDVKHFNDFRNDIFHGKELKMKSKKKVDLLFKIERLLQKIILSILDYYDSRNVHTVIRKQNLLARI